MLAEDFSGKVVGITDGDTIKVMRGGAAERIRLWGTGVFQDGCGGIATDIDP